MEKSTKYLKMDGRSSAQFLSNVALAVGLLGFILSALGALGFFSSKLQGFVIVIPGSISSIVILLSSIRAGLELDPANKRFREFEGMLGRTKDPWIDVEDGDYLAIVGFVDASTGADAADGRYRYTSKEHHNVSKVFFWSGGWHLEIFKGGYGEAQDFSERFAGIFGLSINDVNKDQTLLQGRGAGASLYK